MDLPSPEEKNRFTPSADMKRSERLQELKRLQKQGVPDDAQEFAKWAHKVRGAIFNDGERLRWDFLVAKYKESNLTVQMSRSTKQEMEQLIGLETGDLEDYAKHPGQQPRFWFYLLNNPRQAAYIFFFF